jgi:RNA polymerase sigma-70 factor, ECF subfamily
MMLLDFWSNIVSRSATSELNDSSVTTLPLTVEEIFRSYAPRVYSLARRMLGHDADAEDVTQDVLLQVIRKLDTFRGEALLTTWLYRVTVNAALLHRRKQARRREQQGDVPLEVLLEGMRLCSKPAAAREPHHSVLEKEIQELVEKAIAGLPEMYRDVYVLADVEGLSNAEIGRLLSLSVQAVKSRLHRARLMMREAIACYV